MNQGQASRVGAGNTLAGGQNLVPQEVNSRVRKRRLVASVGRRWLNRLGVKALFVEPGSPWENGHIESFNDKLRDELLNREKSYTLIEAKVLIERWRKEYNQVRPHSCLHYRIQAVLVEKRGIRV